MGRYELEPISNEAFRHLKRIGVKAILYDMDDTLVYTSEIFRRFQDEYSTKVSLVTGLDYSLFNNRLSEINDEEYVKMGVSPTRWQSVVERLATEFKEHGEEILSNLEILMKIYITEPRLRPGAKVVLGSSAAEGFLQAIVTHANVPWAEWKFRVTGLDNYVDAVVIADENGHKKKEHWRRAMELLGVEGQECLVVGDNLRGDILAGTSLGARGIWIPSPWSMYREGEVPSGVATIGNLDQFWDGVLKLR